MMSNVRFISVDSQTSSTEEPSLTSSALNCARAHTQPHMIGGPPISLLLGLCLPSSPHTHIPIQGSIMRCACVSVGGLSAKISLAVSHYHLMQQAYQPGNTCLKSHLQIALFAGLIGSMFRNKSGHPN